MGRATRPAAASGGLYGGKRGIAACSNFPSSWFQARWALVGVTAMLLCYGLGKPTDLVLASGAALTWHLVC